ncbi:MAG TPA: DnaJ C-terminal domain-containing protein [Kofleriaceae bacterium]|jgi:molecular chaperone DnaJ
MARRKRDYYTVLGVAKHASDAEIKRAFRELARRHHPDMNPADGGELFREVNEAYAVLSEPEQRARYDRWGHPEQEGGGLGAVMDAAQEILNAAFGRRRAKNKGGDLRYTLELSFEEAAFGASKTVTLPRSDGPGKREVTVVLAPGVKDGAVKTLKGEGESGKQGGPAGDLQVVVRIADHAAFRRDGLDVRSDVAVTFSQAALGAVIEVPTLDGSVKMRVPGGTQPGSVFRLRGRGIPQAAGKTAPRGDHLVHVQVEVPTELTAKQRELIEELGRVSGEAGAGGGGGGQRPRRLLDRVRSLLDE